MENEKEAKEQVEMELFDKFSPSCPGRHETGGISSCCIRNGLCNKEDCFGLYLLSFIRGKSKPHPFWKAVS